MNFLCKCGAVLNILGNIFDTYSGKDDTVVAVCKRCGASVKIKRGSNGLELYQRE